MVSRKRESRGAFQTKKRAGIKGIKGVVYEDLHGAPPAEGTEARGCREEVGRDRQGQSPKKR